MGCSAKLSKTSLGALLQVLLIFMVTVGCSSEPTESPPPPFQEPIVYLSFTRWENRTFSPRLYYLLLQRYGLKHKLLDLPSDQITATDLHPPPNNVDISTRFGFSGNSNALKEKVNRPGPNRNKLSGFTDRILLTENEQSFDDSEDLKNGTVLFPSVNHSAINGEDDFAHFADRLAYPGTSNRRPSNAPNPPEALVQSQSAAKEFSKIGISSPPVLTDDDIIDTIGLTFDIMRASDWQDENVVFSPLCITNVLAILLLGAEGVTYKEIAAQLRRHNPLSTMDSAKELRYHTAFSNLLQILGLSSSERVSLESFSTIFVDKRFSLAKSFEERAIHYYNAQSNSFDFHKDGELFKDGVNKWIAFKTKGKIPSLVDTPPDPTTTLAIVNAVYFQGSWKTPFIPGITQMKPFHVSPTEILDVEMMTNILTIPYLEEEHFRVIGLPYKDNKTGLFVMLPKNPGVKGLRDLELKLTPETLKKLFNMRLTQVTVQMPKMRVESDGHIQDILAKLGMTTIFDQKNANFSKISDTNTDGLYIKSILHRAVMDVNEKGTEAAAATVATGDRNLDERPVLFAVNRPFTFAIVQVKAKTVLFWGRVTRPQPLPA